MKIPCSKKSDEKTSEQLKKLWKVPMFTAGEYDRIRNRPNAKDRFVDSAERSQSSRQLPLEVKAPALPVLLKEQPIPEYIQ